MKDLFISVLSLFAFAALTLAVQISPVSIAYRFQDKRCVALREIDFLLKKICSWIKLSRLCGD